MMRTIQSTIDAIFIGQARAFGPNGEVSAIQKQQVWDAVSVTTSGLQGDEQGDKLYHGGSDKAVHHYPSEHYVIWRAQFGDDAASRFVWAALVKIFLPRAGLSIRFASAMSLCWVLQYCK
jgi:hypothetical protein